MNVVDSSGWLEYFADGPNATFFAPAVQAERELLVPALSVYEVYRHVCTQRGDDAALEAVALMSQGSPVPLDAALAMEAARVSLAHGLAMADAVTYATALRHGAVFWTQDADFAKVPGVRYAPRRGA